MINGIAAFNLTMGRKSCVVAEKNNEKAAVIDKNRDGKLTNDEVRDYLSSAEEPQVSSDRIAEFKCSLAEVPNPKAQGYHTFDELTAEFQKLAEQHPDLAQMTSLGKTAEGRDIWALKISEGVQGDTSDKPGIVITGCHHAREWMTVEAPLKLAHDLLDNLATDPAAQKRVKESEIWILPCVNPDGYEYSRTTDNMWRKNRRPLEVDQLGKPTTAVGVDLNRNYDDALLEHAILYRPAEDKPGVTSDDMWATSDDPFSDTYRGAHGASEAEVIAMQNLELGHKNVKGVLDYHSYGNDVLYPWGHTEEHSPNYDIYRDIGGKMAAVGGYKLEQSIGLYPTSGTSDGVQEANGVLNFTIEMGKSFQPSPKLIPKITNEVSQQTMIFIDELLDRNAAGTLPAHEPMASVPNVAAPTSSALQPA